MDLGWSKCSTMQTGTSTQRNLTVVTLASRRAEVQKLSCNLPCANLPQTNKPPPPPTLCLEESVRLEPWRWLRDAIRSCYWLIPGCALWHYADETVGNKHCASIFPYCTRWKLMSPCVIHHLVTCLASYRAPRRRHIWNSYWITY